VVERREPRIILYDLETLPDLQAALENWPDLVSPFPGKRPNMSAQVNSICSFGYRVFGESKSHGFNAWDFPSWRKDVNDDRPILKEASAVLADADAVITFNGRRFDEKFLQTRLGLHRMPFLRETQHIDLKSIVAKHLFLLNNRLKTAAKALLNDSKLDHDGWPLWVKVHGGIDRKRDRRAEDVMGRYNLKDVDLMVPLFKVCRPFIKNVPNYNLFQVGGLNVCPKCESTRVQRRGYHITKTSAYHRYHCQDCGSWSRTDAEDKNPRSV
jgi:hypothetical protein